MHWSELFAAREQNSITINQVISIIYIYLYFQTFVFQVS